MNKRKPRNYWTKDKVIEKCKELAQQGFTISELYNKYSAASHAAKREGYLAEVKTILPLSRKERNYWTDERAIGLIKSCKSIKELNEKSEYVYKLALRKKWDDLLNSLINDSLYNGNKVDSVYGYFFKEYNSVYIGRTLIKRQTIRDEEHRSEIYRGKENKDTVFIFAKKNNIAVPKMIIIEEKLTIQEGREREHYWVEFYKTKGLNVLNKAKTGLRSGSIGAVNHHKYSINSAIKESKKYSGMTHSDISKNDSTLYKFIQSNKLWDKMPWIMDEHTARSVRNKEQWAKRKEHITDETIVNFVKDENIQTIKELRKAKWSYYDYARKNKIWYLMPHLIKCRI